MLIKYAYDLVGDSIIGIPEGMPWELKVEWIDSEDEDDGACTLMLCYGGEERCLGSMEDFYLLMDASSCLETIDPDDAYDCFGEILDEVIDALREDRYYLNFRFIRDRVIKEHLARWERLAKQDAGQ